VSAEESKDWAARILSASGATHTREGQPIEPPRFLENIYCEFLAEVGNKFQLSLGQRNTRITTINDITESRYSEIKNGNIRHIYPEDILTFKNGGGGKGTLTLVPKHLENLLRDVCTEYLPLLFRDDIAIALDQNRLRDLNEQIRTNLRDYKQNGQIPQSITIPESSDTLEQVLNRAFKIASVSSQKPNQPPSL
jgi:hypothetical protein